MVISSRRLFAGILFVALFVMAAREIGDPDFWWHLSAGQYMVATRSIPHVDVFSGTVAGLTWVRRFTSKKAAIAPTMMSQVRRFIEVEGA